jgi:hypothetical protein
LTQNGNGKTLGRTDARVLIASDVEAISIFSVGEQHARLAGSL